MKRCFLVPHLRHTREAGTPPVMKMLFGQEKPFPFSTLFFQHLLHRSGDPVFII